MASHPAIVELSWIRDLAFSASIDHESRSIHANSTIPPLLIDSAGIQGPSPVQALALALAGCMSVDVVHIIRKGRHHLRALRSRLVAERSPEEPRRIVAATLHFTIAGEVPDKVVARAIRLSHDKYCSVWHSMRADIDLRVTYQITPDTNVPKR
jgi:putative redox protein